MKIIDKNEEKIFHPSLDIKDGILVLGFRIKKDKDKETDLFIVQTKEGFSCTEELEFKEHEQYFSIDKKKGYLLNYLKDGVAIKQIYLSNQSVIH